MFNAMITLKLIMHSFASSNNYHNLQKYWLKLLVTHFNCMLYFQIKKTTFLKVLNEKISIFRIIVFYFCVLVCWYAQRHWMTFTGSLIQWDATFCRPFYINHSTSGNILCKLILSPPLSHRQILLNHTSWEA